MKLSKFFNYLDKFTTSDAFKYKFLMKTDADSSAEVLPGNMRTFVMLLDNKHSQQINKYELICLDSERSKILYTSDNIDDVYNKYYTVMMQENSPIGRSEENCEDFQKKFTNCLKNYNFISILPNIEKIFFNEDIKSMNIYDYLLKTLLSRDVYADVKFDSIKLFAVDRNARVMRANKDNIIILFNNRYQKNIYRKIDDQYSLIYLTGFDFDVLDSGAKTDLIERYKYLIQATDLLKCEHDDQFIKIYKNILQNISGVIL